MVTKQSGCDAVVCPFCRTVLCWATKGRRWGPLGENDISGGCRCGVDKKPCHPNCRNCHWSSEFFQNESFTWSSESWSFYVCLFMIKLTFLFEDLTYLYKLFTVSFITNAVVFLISNIFYVLPCICTYVCNVFFLNYDCVTKSGYIWCPMHSITM